MIYSIAPENVHQEIKVTKKFGLNPTAKLFDIELNPGISYTSETVYNEVHPLIIGHYSAKQTWDYTTGKGVNDIEGVQKIEFMVKQLDPM